LTALRRSPTKYGLGVLAMHHRAGVDSVGDAASVPAGARQQGVPQAGIRRRRALERLSRGVPWEDVDPGT
jgi:hypothetical protein